MIDGGPGVKDAEASDPRASVHDGSRADEAALADLDVLGDLCGRTHDAGKL
jgi:hypothetical protein